LAAVLDYRLGDESVRTLCALLSERRIPFMFYTGYGALEASYPDAVVVQKPSTGRALLTAMAGLVEPGTRAPAGEMA
jgi:hypothetical protein